MKLVKPQDYSTKQIQFIEEFESALAVLSKTSNILIGAKDIYSRHIIATDACARMIGFSSGRKVKGKLDAEMPLLATANYAAKYTQEDQR